MSAHKPPQRPVTPPQAPPAAFVSASIVRASGLISESIGWFGADFFSHVDTVLPDTWCDAHAMKDGKPVPRGTAGSVPIPKGSLLGARSDHHTHFPDGSVMPWECLPGVRIRPPGYAKWTARLIVQMPCTPEQAQKDLDFGLAQLGEPYETMGLLKTFSGLFHWQPRNWRDPSAWWCSELRMRQWEVAGIVEVPLPFWRITPGDCALAACARQGTRIVESYGLPPAQ